MAVDWLQATAAIAAGADLNYANCSSEQSDWTADH